MMSRAWMRFAGPAVLAAVVAMLCGAGASSPAAPEGHYTHAQATRGQFVYIQECLSCHGARLQGISGPPLQGPNFGRSMALGRMTAASLYAFIKGGMPMNAPGIEIRPLRTIAGSTEFAELFLNEVRLPQ